VRVRSGVHFLPHHLLSQPLRRAAQQTRPTRPLDGRQQELGRGGAGVGFPVGQRGRCAAPALCCGDPPPSAGNAVPADRRGREPPVHRAVPGTSLLEAGQQGLGRAARPVEVGGTLPALLLVHAHGAEEDAGEAAANYGDGRESVSENIGFEKRRGLVRGQNLFAIRSRLNFNMPAPPGFLSSSRMHRQMRRHAVGTDEIARLFLAQNRMLILRVLLQQLNLSLVCPSDMFALHRMKFCFHCLLIGQNHSKTGT